MSAKVTIEYDDGIHKQRLEIHEVRFSGPTDGIRFNVEPYFPVRSSLSAPRTFVNLHITGELIGQGETGETHRIETN